MAVQSGRVRVVAAGVRPDGEWTAERVNVRFPCSAACATHPRTLLTTVPMHIPCKSNNVSPNGILKILLSPIDRLFPSEFDWNAEVDFSKPQKFSEVLDGR